MTPNAHYGYGNAQESRREIEQLLTDMRAGGRTHDAIYMEVLRQVGRARNSASEYAAALPVYEEAMDLQLALYGEENRTMPNLLIGTATSYAGLKRAFEAKELFHRTINVSERVYGKVHAVTHNAYYFTGDFYYFSLFDQPQAERLIRKAIEASPAESRGTLGIDHHRLAELLLRQGKLFEADYHAALAHDYAVAVYSHGTLVDNTRINAAFIAWRRYDMQRAAGGLSGSLLARRRDDDSDYYAEMRNEADQLSAFFGWNRGSGGTTIAPPLQR